MPSMQLSPLQQAAVEEQAWPDEGHVAGAHVKFTQPSPVQQSPPEVQTPPDGWQARVEHRSTPVMSGTQGLLPQH